MSGGLTVPAGDRAVTTWWDRDLERPGRWLVGAGCTCGFTVERSVATEDPAVVEHEADLAYQEVRVHLAEAPECMTRRAGPGERPTALGAALGAADAIEEDMYRDRLDDPGPDLWGQL